MRFGDKGEACIADTAKWLLSLKREEWPSLAKRVLKEIADNPGWSPKTDEEAVTAAILQDAGLVMRVKEKQDEN